MLIKAMNAGAGPGCRPSLFQRDEIDTLQDKRQSPEIAFCMAEAEGCFVLVNTATVRYRQMKENSHLPYCRLLLLYCGVLNKVCRRKIVISVCLKPIAISAVSQLTSFDEELTLDEEIAHSIYGGRLLLTEAALSNEDNLSLYLPATG